MLFDNVTDVLMTLEGDLEVENGDLSVTSGVDWYTREVNKRLRSGRDWQHHPSIGTNLLQYAGAANNRETGTRIREDIRKSLSLDSIHLPATLEIKVVPTSRTSIHIFVILVHAGERALASSLVMDIKGGILRDVPDPTPVTTPPMEAPHDKTTNKYLERARRR
jgi:hypothetical protein